MKAKLTFIAGLLTLGVAGCPNKDGNDDPVEDAGRSPNAILRPSPRSSVSPLRLPPRDAGYDGPIGIAADSRGRLARPDARAPAPTPLVPARALPPDRTRNREVRGLSLEASWNWQDVPSAPEVGEVNREGLDNARESTRHEWKIELLEFGRMRIVFDSPSFTVTKFTEIRARTAHFGHILIWPDIEAYRIVPPGAMRALLDERRLDVSPIVAGRLSTVKSSPPRFGFPTKTRSAKTPWGKLELQQAKTTNAGQGGPLLCRLLAELISVRPQTALCEENLVPVHAKIAWKDGGSITFEVGSLLIRKDFPVSLFTVPPPGAKFTDSGLPPDASGIFLDRAQMAAFRTRNAPAPSPRTDPEATGAPGEGFIALNRTDALRFLVLDGIPVAWVPPHGKKYVIGSRPGRYSVQWRSFLGVETSPAREILIPARIALGEPPDAGGHAGAAGAPPP